LVGGNGRLGGIKASMKLAAHVDVVCIVKRDDDAVAGVDHPDHSVGVAVLAGDEHLGVITCISSEASGACWLGDNVFD